MLLGYNHGCKNPAREVKFVDFLNLPLKLQTSVILLHEGLDDLVFAATIILQRLFYNGSLWHSYRCLHCLPAELVLRSKAVAANCLLLFLKLRVSFRKEKKQ